MIKRIVLLIAVFFISVSVGHSQPPSGGGCADNCSFTGTTNLDSPVIVDGTPLSILVEKYKSRGELVVVNNYGITLDASPTGGFGRSGAGDRFLEFLNDPIDSRIRQSGEVKKIKFFFDNSGPGTNLQFVIWRGDGTTDCDTSSDECYDLIGRSHNILSEVTDGGYNEIEISIPDTQIGDTYGWRWDTDGVGSSSQFNLTTNSTERMERVWEAANGGTGPPDQDSFDWYDVGTRTGTANVQTEIYMESPNFVLVGDSIAGGNTYHYTIGDNSGSQAYAFDTTIAHHLSDMTGFTYQEFGVGSEETAALLSRFSTDVIAFKPRFVVIVSGVNDLSGNPEQDEVWNDTGGYVANMKSMIVLCEANDIIPVIVKVLPWTAGTHRKMMARDYGMMPALETMLLDHPQVLLVDAEDYVGINDPVTTNWTAAGGASTAQVLWEDVIPDTPNGFAYYATVASGTTGTSEPSAWEWSQGTGSYVYDDTGGGTQIWKNAGLATANKWDIAPMYLDPTGGVHFNSAGNKRIAQAIYDKLIGNVKIDSIYSEREYISEVSISATQMKAIESTPIELVPAQGADTLIEVLSATLLLKYGSEVLSEDNDPDDLALEYDGGTGTQIATMESTAFIEAGSDFRALMVPATTSAGVATATDTNKNVVLINTGTAYTGNATGDTIVRVITRYKIHQLGLVN